MIQFRNARRQKNEVILSVFSVCVVNFPPQVLNLKVLVVDLKERRVLEPVFIRAEQGWKVAELKTEIAEVCVDGAYSWDKPLTFDLP